MDEGQTTEKVRPLARGTLRLQSDERLVKLFRRGVEPAFDELVRRYRSSLVAYAGSIAGWDRAEDVVQDSLVKAHRSLEADRDIEPRPWLYTVVRNTALNDIRDNRKHRHDDLGDSAGSESTPADLVEQRERFAAVLAAVADLPPAQRRALVDHELSGFSHEEIAAELDLSTGATKQLIYRARLSLRNAFGAMIPLPVIAWLAEGSGVLAGGAAGTGAGATATGILGSVGGGGAAKIAVVAVVAGGSLAGGIAVEKHRTDNDRTRPDVARAADPSHLATVAGSQTVSDVTPEEPGIAGPTAEADASGALKARNSAERGGRDDGGDRSGSSGLERDDSSGHHVGGGQDRPSGGRPGGSGQRPVFDDDRGGSGGGDSGHGGGPGRDGSGGGPGHGGDHDSGGSQDGDDYRPSGSSGPGPSGGSGGSGSTGGSGGRQGSGGSGSTGGSGGSSGGGGDGSGDSGSSGSSGSGSSGSSGSGSSGGYDKPPGDSGGHGGYKPDDD